MEKRLFVGNLNYSTTEDELRTAFSAHGTVESVTIIAGKGFGFVEMATEQDAKAAMDALNSSSIGGRNISVNEARPREDRPRGDRPRGGGFDRGGRGGRDDRPRRDYGRF